MRARTSTSNASRKSRAGQLISFMRLGMIGKSFSSGGSKRDAEADARKFYTITNVKLLKDKDFDVLSYEVKSSDSKDMHNVKLWFISKSHKLVKRLDNYKTKKTHTVTLELYHEFEFDEDIPDEKFSPPAQK